MLAAQLQRVAQNCSMPRPVKKLADNSTNLFERNRDFIRSGIPWLIREGIAWAAANQSWVEVICDEQGTPFDLEVYF
ncbi:MAG: hypothetical protein ACRC2V_10800 [Xenococcaceae cyanobacterium]